jgi:hypothetical protein
MNIRLSAGEDPTRLSKPPLLAQQPSRPTDRTSPAPSKPFGHRVLAAEESRPFPTSCSYLTFWCQMAT